MRKPLSSCSPTLATTPAAGSNPPPRSPPRKAKSTHPTPPSSSPPRTFPWRASSHSSSSSKTFSSTAAPSSPPAPTEPNSCPAASPTAPPASTAASAPPRLKAPPPSPRTGHVTTDVPVRWDNPDPQFQVAQRCSNDAVVVTYQVGAGHVIWWASPRPLTNAGLDDDPNLALLLASIGPADGRVVLFDEYLHQQRESLADTLHGLPWWSLGLQLALLLLLLILSNSRRSGPLRAPVALPRTSPLEFAESMGRLYARAQATPAATEAARARLHETLRTHCALPRETIAAGPAEIAHALTLRFGGNWSTLELHLQQAQQASAGTIATASALKLVQSLEADNQLLLATLTRPTATV